MTNSGDMQSVLHKSTDKIFEVLLQQIDDYEQHFKVDNSKTIVEWMESLQKTSQGNMNWLVSLYSTLVTQDLYFSGVTDFLNLVKSKRVNLAGSKFLGFGQDQLMQALGALQNLATVDSLDKGSIALIGNQAEKLLKPNTLEYRVFRILCIAKVLNLLSTCNVVAKFLITQNAIIEPSKIQITPNINE